MDNVEHPGPEDYQLQNTANNTHITLWQRANKSFPNINQHP